LFYCPDNILSFYPFSAMQSTFIFTAAFDRHEGLRGGIFFAIAGLRDRFVYGIGPYKMGAGD
jgi:hypothetical protein